MDQFSFSVFHLDCIFWGGGSSRWVKEKAPNFGEKIGGSR